MTETVVQQRRHVLAAGFSNPLNLPANAEEASHVKVYADDELLTLSVDYSLDGVGDTGDLDEIVGVNATLEEDVLLAGYTSYTIEHVPPMDQTVSLSSGGTLGRIYERGLDWLARRMQSLAAKIDRRLVLPVDSSASPILPTPEPRRALMWNDAGTALTNSFEDPDNPDTVDASAFAERAEEALASAEAVLAAAEAARDAALAAQTAAEAAASAAGDPEAIAAMGVAVGMSCMFTHTNYPTSAFLKENGAVVSQAAYPELYAAIGDNYNTGGEGAGNFRLPESRGEFFRAWDDGRGIDVDRSLYAAQSEMVGPHTHVATAANGGAHSHSYSIGLECRRGANGFINAPGWSSGDVGTGSATYSGGTNTNGDHTHTITVNNNSGTENRPRNVARLVVIKYAVYEPPEE
jgi:microcystin-dependent protein